MKIQAKIQKWGNGLALRVSGPMRDIPHFTAGSEVDVEVMPEGLVIKKSALRLLKKLPFSEADLLEGMTPQKAHADELAVTLSSEVRY